MALPSFYDNLKLSLFSSYFHSCLSVCPSFCVSLICSLSLCLSTNINTHACVFMCACVCNYFLNLHSLSLIINHSLHPKVTLSKNKNTNKIFIYIYIYIYILGVSRWNKPSVCVYTRAYVCICVYARACAQMAVSRKLVVQCSLLQPPAPHHLPYPCCVPRPIHSSSPSSHPSSFS